MEITVLRYSSGKETTLGLMMVNGSFAAYTLEDQHRDVKVMGDTRIPAGRYKLDFRTVGGHHTRYQDKFPDIHKGMLHVTNVPNFEYILIHIGNTDDDTAGCLLVGDQAHSNVKDKGRINSSTNAYKRVYPIIANTMAMGEEVWITYVDQIPLDTDYEEGEEASVVPDQLNFRTSPGGQKQGVFFEDAIVEVIEERNGWSHVVADGWVSSRYIERT